MVPYLSLEPMETGIAGFGMKELSDDEAELDIISVPP